MVQSNPLTSASAKTVSALSGLLAQLGGTSTAKIQGQTALFSSFLTQGTASVAASGQTQPDPRVSSNASGNLADTSSSSPSSVAQKLNDLASSLHTVLNNLRRQNSNQSGGQTQSSADQSSANVSTDTSSAQTTATVDTTQTASTSVVSTSSSARSQQSTSSSADEENDNNVEEVSSADIANANASAATQPALTSDTNAGQWQDPKLQDNAALATQDQSKDISDVLSELIVLMQTVAQALPQAPTGNTDAASVDVSATSIDALTSDQIAQQVSPQDLLSLVQDLAQALKNALPDQTQTTAATTQATDFLSIFPQEQKVATDFFIDSSSASLSASAATTSTSSTTSDAVSAAATQTTTAAATDVPPIQDATVDVPALPQLLRDIAAAVRQMQPVVDRKLDATQKTAATTQDPTQALLPTANGSSSPTVAAQFTSILTTDTQTQKTTPTLPLTEAVDTVDTFNDKLKIVLSVAEKAADANTQQNGSDQTTKAAGDDKATADGLTASLLATTDVSVPQSKPAFQPQAPVVSFTAAVAAVPVTAAAQTASGGMSDMSGDMLSEGNRGTAAAALANNDNNSAPTIGNANFQQQVVNGARSSSPALPAHQAASIVNQVAVQITRSVKTGDNQITVQLNPEELGKISVKLTVGEDGSVKGTVTANNPQTLETLQKESRTLERLLQDSGLRADAGSLQFNLGQQQDNNAAQRQQEAAENKAASGNRGDGTETAYSETDADEGEDVSENYYLTPTGVNIRV